MFGSAQLAALYHNVHYVERNKDGQPLRQSDIKTARDFIPGAAEPKKRFRDGDIPISFDDLKAQFLDYNAKQG